MLGKVDHGLCSAGIEEAEYLRQQILVEVEAALDAAGDGDADLGIMEATAVFSSPLTRAIQTALIGLQDFDTMKENGVKLMKDLREIKCHVTSRDTVQSCQGQEIAKHVQNELKKVDSVYLEDGLMVPIDHNDAVGHWCGGTENNAHIEARQDAVLAAISKAPHKVIILVGHSMFFMVSRLQV
jgi:broad specificity phosphatase PhoE